MIQEDPKIKEKKQELKNTIDASLDYHKRREVEKTEIENTFLIDVFPSPFKELITESQKVFNFPPDYTGLAVLVAISTAIGKSAKLKVKSNWYEFPAIYAGIIGNPGASKSHPIETAFKPFEEIDRVQIKMFDQEYKKFEEYQALTKKAKENQPKPEKPKLIKTLLHNFTPEILHQRLTDNDRGCTIVSDELATFLDGMNNYSKGDQISPYLSFWSNKPMSIDRVSKPVPLWLPQPFLNIIGSIQPRVLPKLFPVNKINNGFLQRFLFAFPDNAEKQPINDNEIEESVLTKYAGWINKYRLHSQITIDEETEKPMPKIYHWSNEAKKFFYQWQKENTDKVNEQLGSLDTEILSKFDIHFCRLSLILHIMEDYENREISLKAVEGAAKLCAYFLKCAFKVLDVLGSQNKADELPEDKKKLFEALPDEFTTAEGLLIAENLDIPERTYKRFISDNGLFKRLKVGK